MKGVVLHDEVKQRYGMYKDFDKQRLDDIMKAKELLLNATPKHEIESKREQTSKSESMM